MVPREDGREKGRWFAFCFWVGRAGVTLGAAQTRQGTSGSLDSPFAAASSGETGCEPKTQAQPRDHRGTAPSVRTYLFPETHRSSRAATTAAKSASTLSGSNWVQAQPAGRCPDPPRNLRFLGFSICCRVFGRNGVRTQNAGAAPRPSRDCAVSSYLPFPRNAPQQSSRDHRGEECVSFERQQLGAGSACWALPRPAKEP